MSRTFLARRRIRSRGEQEYWDRLSPRERLAFMLGFTVGQGHPFPNKAMLDHLRVELGITRTRNTAPAIPGRCRQCGGPIAPRQPGQRGRPRTRCETCKPPRTTDA